MRKNAAPSNNFFFLLPVTSDDTTLSSLRPGDLRPELLSPAGDMECARAAVANGADAIYFGLDRFNARLRADNFTLDSLPELMRFLHAHGVKGYVTMNTLIFTSEMEDALAYLGHLNAARVDGVIVQDTGLARCLTEWGRQDSAMKLELHASTQMTLTSPAGLDFASGFLDLKQAVLARELSLKEIGECVRHTDIPLEVFVHGALCVAYSGQCLTSESLGQRSANRGECAQACRLPYALVVDGKQVPLGERRYLLSPQDLCAIDRIPDLVRMGVRSYKIEGRLKSPEYVAAVTAAYRKALDAACAGLPVDGMVTARDRYALQMVFSRGFSTGWLDGTDHPRLTHGRHGKKRGAYAGVIVDSGQGWLDIRPEGVIPLAPGDGFVIDAGEDRNEEQGGRIWKVQRNRLFFHGKASRIDWNRVKPGQKLWKTDDPALNAELKKMREHLPEAAIPLHLTCTGSAGEPLTVLCLEYGCSVQSSQALQTAEKRPLTPETLEQQLGRLGGTGFRLASCDCRLPEGLMLPLSILNQTRRALVERIQAVRQEREASAPASRLPAPFILPALPAGTAAPDMAPHLSVLCRRVEQVPAALDSGADALYLDFEDIRDYAAGVETVRKNERTAPVFLATPRIQKPSETGYFKLMERAEPDGILIRNLGAAEYFRHSPLRRIGDFSLNVANPYSAAILKEQGNLDYLTISYDLNAGQVADLLRGAPPEWFELTLHQHMPMFHMEHCVFCTFLSEGTSYKNCGHPCERYQVQLRDRVGQLHPLLADAGCRNTLFNARAQTGAGFFRDFRRRGLSRFRVELLDDSPEKTRLLVSRYRGLLDGSCNAAALIRELDVAEQLGTTEGTLRPR